MKQFLQALIITAVLVAGTWYPSGLRGPAVVVYPPVIPPIPATPFVGHLGPNEAHPDASVTPGITNPDITEQNIQDTICNPNWSTASIRPPTSYTSALKLQQQIADYDDTNPKDYEEDHFISLELGGAPTDPANLWAEPYLINSWGESEAKERDAAENALHNEVCAGTLTLEQAQHIISYDWYAYYKDKIPASLGATLGIDPDDE